MSNLMSNLLDVNDCSVKELLLENVLICSTGDVDPVLINELKIKKKEKQIVKLQFSPEEVESLNLILNIVYNHLVIKLDNAESVIEKSLLEEFFDTFESVVTKVNEYEIE